MKSIFNRVDDPKIMSREKILLFALLFFVATRIACSVVIGIILQLYSAHGIDAMAELQFAGNADRMAAEAGNMGGLAAVVLQLMIVAPLLEECAFRLGLSFRRWHVAAGAGALTLFFVSRFCAMPWAAAAGVVAAAAVGTVTTDDMWTACRQRWLVPAAWVSALLFGAVHMFAMRGLSLTLLPLALMMCLMLSCAGAVFGYLRINLGFGWGLAAHILNNVPPLIMLLTSAD